MSLPSPNLCDIEESSRSVRKTTSGQLAMIEVGEGMMQRLHGT